MTPKQGPRAHFGREQPRFAFETALEGLELVIIAADVGHQLVVGAALDDPALVEDDDLVAVADGAQAVGDDQAGAAAAAEVVVDERLGHRVERAGRLVEDEQRRVADQGPGDLQPLPLTAREVPCALRQSCVIATPPSDRDRGGCRRRWRPGSCRGR